MQTGDPLDSLRSFLEDLDNAVVVACRLVREGHRIDLTGFEAQVGLLCAKALDLPVEQGRSIRPDLVRLRTRVEALTTDLLAAHTDA